MNQVALFRRRVGIKTSILNISAARRTKIGSKQRASLSPTSLYAACIHLRLILLSFEAYRRNKLNVSVSCEGVHMMRFSDKRLWSIISSHGFQFAYVKLSRYDKWKVGKSLENAVDRSSCEWEIKRYKYSHSLPAPCMAICPHLAEKPTSRLES